MTRCDSCGLRVDGHGNMTRHRAACQAPVFCPCAEHDCAGPDPDVIGQCRCCGLADLRSPRMADTAALLDAAKAPT